MLILVETSPTTSAEIRETTNQQENSIAETVHEEMLLTFNIPLSIRNICVTPQAGIVVWLFIVSS